MSEHKGANAALYLRCLAHHNKATRDALTRTGSPVAALVDFVSGEIAAEREACAKLADAHAATYRSAGIQSRERSAIDLAEAIRRRGKA